MQTEGKIQTTIIKRHEGRGPRSVLIWVQIGCKLFINKRQKSSHAITRLTLLSLDRKYCWFSMSALVFLFESDSFIWSRKSIRPILYKEMFHFSKFNKLLEA